MMQQWQSCVTNQTTNTMKVCSHRKVEVQYCDKRSSFPGVTARSVMIFTYINFHPKKAIEFTATAAVFISESWSNIL